MLKNLCSLSVAEEIRKNAFYNIRVGNIIYLYLKTIDMTFTVKKTHTNRQHICVHHITSCNINLNHFNFFN